MKKLKVKRIFSINKPNK